MSSFLSTTLQHAAKRNLPKPIGNLTAEVLEHIRQGCFQRSLSLIVAGTSVASGLEVSYEHYKGSYSNPVMYTPVVLSGALAAASLLGALNAWSARVLLRWVSMASLANGLIGFFFQGGAMAGNPAAGRCQLQIS